MKFRNSAKPDDGNFMKVQLAGCPLPTFRIVTSDNSHPSFRSKTTAENVSKKLREVHISPNRHL